MDGVEENGKSEGRGDEDKRGDWMVRTGNTEAKFIWKFRKETLEKGALAYTGRPRDDEGPSKVCPRCCGHCRLQRAG